VHFPPLLVTSISRPVEQHEYCVMRAFVSHILRCSEWVSYRGSSFCSTAQNQADEVRGLVYMDELARIWSVHDEGHMRIHLELPKDLDRFCAIFGMYNAWGSVRSYNRARATSPLQESPCQFHHKRRSPEIRRQFSDSSRHSAIRRSSRYDAAPGRLLLCVITGVYIGRWL
jgi:hypothetical protein